MTAAASIPQTVSVQASDPATTRAAFEQTADERAAIPRDQLKPIPGDVARVASIVFATIERIGFLMPKIRSLPEVRLRLIDALVRRTSALLHADFLYLTATGQPTVIKALLEDAVPLRARLLDWGPTLVNWGVVAKQEYDAWKAGFGHADLGYDLVSVGETYVTRWARIEGKTTLTLAECQQAVDLGRKVLTAVGAKADPTTLARTSEERRRAWTLVHASWDELLRAVVFLRWHDGDAHELVPNLATAVRRPPTKATPEPSTPEAPAAPTTETSTPETPQQ